MINYTSTGPETERSFLDDITTAGVLAALTTCLTWASFYFVNKVALPPCMKLAEEVGRYFGSYYRRYNS